MNWKLTGWNPFFWSSAPGKFRKNAGHKSLATLVTDKALAAFSDHSDPTRELGVRFCLSHTRVFNPSLLVLGDGSLLLVVRRSLTQDQHSKLQLARAKTLTKLPNAPLWTVAGSYGVADARLFRFGGRVMAASHGSSAVAYSAGFHGAAMQLLDLGFDSDWTIDGERDCDCDKTSDKKVQSTSVLLCSGLVDNSVESVKSAKSEKNWVPLVSGGVLYWLYTLHPFRLLRTRLDPANKGPLPPILWCADVDRPISYRSAPTGSRGSSAACETPRGLLVATHRRLRTHPASYTQGLLLLDATPPFRLLAESPPLVLKEIDDFTYVERHGDIEGSTETSLRHANFHFLNDITYLDGDVLFSVGLGDVDAAVFSAPLTTLLALLRPPADDR